MQELLGLCEQDESNVLGDEALLSDEMHSLKRAYIILEGFKNIEDRYIGVLSHTFYCNFCRDIACLSFYRGYRYIEDRCIGVPLS